ncbi:hypothetical protein GL263_15015 [Streptomyces durbertensis]|uniref:Large membrane protein n=1 Tax=Streptomyces durbertensis TaxID=2448886 RepID=A0ABR6EHS1_9ACTN|nr:hypothetical protein [Streptomyces durbertensis]MBB1244865.1 hypothetical protein [Streptomyces durbertensis]
MSTGTPAGETSARPRRRRLTAVSVAAAVVLAGGGTYLLQSTFDGNRTGTASDEERRAPEPLVLDGHGSAEDAARTNGDAPDLRLAGPATRAPERAPVYRAGSVPRAAVERLADALGVSAEPARQGDGWLVTEGRDGTGPSLRVRATGAGERGQWNFTATGPAVGPGCGKLPGAEPGGKPGVGPGPGKPPRCPMPHEGGVLPDAPVAPDSGPGSPDGTVSSDDTVSSDGVVSSDGDTPVDSPALPAPGADDGGEPVSEQRAKKAAAPVLRALDLEKAELDASATTGALRTVVAKPKLDGLPVRGWDTALTVDATGTVVAGHGSLAPLEAGPSYPVLDAKRTLSELNRTRASGATEPHCVQEPCEAPAEKRAGGEVRRAVFGLAAHSSEGRPVLVPSWHFELAGGGAVTHPAVDPKHLAPANDASRGPSGAEPGQPGSVDPADPVPHAGEFVEPYRPGDRRLTVHFWGGVCSDYSAKAVESAERVRIVIKEREHQPGGVCIKIAKEMKLDVELEKPVGEREVVDGRGEPLPQRESRR